MAAKRSSQKAEKTPTESLSNKEIVKQKFEDAYCLPVKNGCCIMNQVDEGSPVHAGLAKTEEDAWKLAAHAVM